LASERAVYVCYSHSPPNRCAMLRSGHIVRILLALAAVAAEASSPYVFEVEEDASTCRPETSEWDFTSALQVAIEVESGGDRKPPQASTVAVSDPGREEDVAHNDDERSAHRGEHSQPVALVSSDVSSAATAAGTKVAAQLGEATGASISNTVIIVLLVLLACLGVFLVARDAMMFTDGGSAETRIQDPLSPSGRSRSMISVPGRPSLAAPPTAGRRSLAPSGRPSLTPAAGAPSSMPVMAMQPGQTSSGVMLPVAASLPATAGGGLGSNQVLTLPISSARIVPGHEVRSLHVPAAASGLRPATPIRDSVMSRGTVAASPRRMSTLPLQRPMLAQVADEKLMLVEPRTYAGMEPFFVVPVDQLYGDNGNTFDFKISTGALGEVAFKGSVTSTPPMRKRVLTLSLPGARGHLATCSPSPGACAVVGGILVEPSTELQLRNRDNIVWGTLAPRGSDRYVVYRGSELVLTMEGDQEAGRLIVVLEGEAIAHAAKSQFGEYLEIGVKPNIDPVLMLLCMMSVVIFNPEEAHSPPARVHH